MLIRFDSFSSIHPEDSSFFRLLFIGSATNFCVARNKNKFWDPQKCIEQQTNNFTDIKFPIIFSPFFLKNLLWFFKIFFLLDFGAKLAACMWSISTRNSNWKFDERKFFSSSYSGREFCAEVGEKKGSIFPSSLDIKMGKKICWGWESVQWIDGKVELKLKVWSVTVRGVLHVTSW